MLELKPELVSHFLSDFTIQLEIFLDWFSAGYIIAFLEFPADGWIAQLVFVLPQQHVDNAIGFFAA